MKPETLYEYLQIYDTFRAMTSRGRVPWADHDRRMVMEAAFRFRGVFYERSEDGQVVAMLISYPTKNPVVKQGKNVLAEPGAFLYWAVLWSSGEDKAALLRLRRESIAAFPEVTHVAYHLRRKRHQLTVHEVRRAESEAPLSERQLEGVADRHLRSPGPGDDLLPWEVHPAGATAGPEDEPETGWPVPG